MLRFALSGCLAIIGSPLGCPCFGFVKIFIVQSISLAQYIFQIAWSLFRKFSGKLCSLVVVKGKVRRTIWA